MAHNGVSVRRKRAPPVSVKSLIDIAFGPPDIGGQNVRSNADVILRIEKLLRVADRKCFTYPRTVGFPVDLHQTVVSPADGIGLHSGFFYEHGGDQKRVELIVRGIFPD